MYISEIYEIYVHAVYRYNNFDLFYLCVISVDDRTLGRANVLQKLSFLSHFKTETFAYHQMKVGLGQHYALQKCLSYNAN